MDKKAIIPDEVVVEALLKDARKFERKWALKTGESLRTKPNTNFLQRQLVDAMKRNKKIDAKSQPGRSRSSPTKPGPSRETKSRSFSLSPKKTCKSPSISPKSRRLDQTSENESSSNSSSSTRPRKSKKMRLKYYTERHSSSIEFQSNIEKQSRSPTKQLKHYRYEKRSRSRSKDSRHKYYSKRHSKVTKSRRSRSRSVESKRKYSNRHSSSSSDDLKSQYRSSKRRSPHARSRSKFANRSLNIRLNSRSRGLYSKSKRHHSCQSTDSDSS